MSGDRPGADRSGKASDPPSGTARSPRWPLALLAAGLVLGAIGIAAALPRPLTQDEVDPFAPAAVEIARNGPAALGERSESSPFPGGTRFEIPHPPLYPLALSAAFRLAGPTALAARGLGLLCHVAAVFLLVLLARRMAGNRPGIGGTGLAASSAGLYLLLPIAIQYPLFIDIDNSLLTPLLLGLLLLAVRLDETASSPRDGQGAMAARAGWEKWTGWTGAAVLFAVCLWCKETPPYLALAAIGAWWALRHGLVHSLVRWGPVGAAGSALFGATWWLFARATGVPVDAFWQYTIRNKLLEDGAPSIGPDLATLWNETQWTVVWMLPAFLLLGALAVAARAVAAARSRRVEAIDLAAIYCIVFVLVHGLYYPGIKYLFPIVAPLALLIGALAIERIGRIRPIEAALFVAVVAALTLAFLWLGRDPIAPGWGVRREVFFLTALPLAGASVVFILGAGPVAGQVAGFARGGLLALGAVCLAGTIHIDVRHVKMDTAVPSHGDYGERGANDLIDRLDRHLSAEALMIARVDVAFALRHGRERPGRSRVVVGLFRNEPQVERSELRKLLADPRLEAVSTDEVPRGHWPEFTREEALEMAREAGFTREEAIGDFTLLTRSADPAQAPSAGPSGTERGAATEPAGATGRSSGSRSSTEPG